MKKERVLFPPGFETNVLPENEHATCDAVVNIVY